jgi:predicted short-subunit dehydrogenase-like oxidoreductase (DUF2520 family)
VIVLSVPDHAIAGVSERIAANVSVDTIVVHCAGARSQTELDACRAAGALTGVMHPLVSFPDTRTSPTLAGTTFTINGDPRAVAACKRIASACGAYAVVAPTGDAAYHAAAALVANGSAALAYFSVSILVRLGFTRRDAQRAVGGLLRTVGENVQRIGVPDALTGPIARGEPDTVRAHRAALRRVSRSGLSAYDAIVPVIVRCARAAGLSRARAAEILSTLRR